MGGRQGPRFTAAEDEALCALLMNKKRAKWPEVSKSMKALGYEHRSTASLRNRYLRFLQARNDKDSIGKNRCRLCGQLQRGHVCTATKTPPPLPPPEPPPPAENDEAGAEAE